MGKEATVVFRAPRRESITSPERLADIKQMVELRMYRVAPEKIAERILEEAEARATKTTIKVSRKEPAKLKPFGKIG